MPRVHRILSSFKSCGLLLAAVAVLSGCGSNGSSAPPPTDVAVLPGDGRAVVSWTAEAGVEYWLFGAADPALTPSHWTGLTGSFANIDVVSPRTVCGLTNDTAYYFALNGRKNDGPGGQSSAVVSATPRAAGASWTKNEKAADPFGSADWRAVAPRRSLACSNTPKSGINYVAVGAGGAVLTSADGIQWAPATKPEGFVSGLNAVVPSGDSSLWVAVGDESAVLVSSGGTTWSQRTADTAAAGRAFRGITLGGLFVAVGDGGLIQTSSDGSTWEPRTSGTTKNLRAVAYSSGRYVAVGDGGITLTSVDGGVTWEDKSSPAVVADLTSIAAGSIKVSTTSGGVTTSVFQAGMIAAGAGGTVLVSKDAGATFSVVSIASDSSLGTRGVTATTRFVGATHASRFMLVDASGRAWGSTDGVEWAGAATGSDFDTKVAAPAAITGADGRYIVVGAAGSSAVSF